MMKHFTSPDCCESYRCFRGDTRCVEGFEGARDQASKEWKETVKRGAVATTDVSVQAQTICQNSPTRLSQPEE